MSIATEDPGIPCGADLSAPTLACLIASATASAAMLPPHDIKYTGYSSPSTSTLTSTPASTPVSSTSVTPAVSRSASRSPSPAPSRASELAANQEHAARSASSSGSGSCSSSSSSSSHSNSSTGLARLRFPHFRAPSVANSPVLVQMCEHCIEADDAPDLAAIARARGLPAQLRARAWPFLLRTHPHVLNPRLLPASEGAMDISTEVPHKRIHNDLARLLQRVARTRRGRPGSAASSTPPSAPLSSSGSPLSVLSPSAGDSVGSAMDQQPASNMLRPAVVESLERAVAAFIIKYGHQAPYERGMVWVAYTLSQAMGGIPLEAEVFEDAMLVFLHDDDATDGVIDNDIEGSDAYRSRSSSQSYTALHSSGPSDYAQETEHKDDRSASASGCMARTVAYFLAQIRAQLPALGQHFDQECMLGFLANEEWLVWWLKWFGARALYVDDAARLWDTYFGFRELCDSRSALTPRERHVFNSLSVLSAIQFRLLELDQSEMRQMLLQLPALDMELVAGRAEDLADRARERQQELNIKRSGR